MKKGIKTLAIAICAVLTLAGCSKSAEELIIGTWIENDVTYTVVQGDQTTSLPMLEPNETAEITFNEDGTYTTIYHSSVGDTEKTGTWSINGETITFTDEFGPMDYHIDKLNKKACDITYTESGEDEDGPYTATFSIKMTRK